MKRLLFAILAMILSHGAYGQLLETVYLDPKGIGSPFYSQYDGDAYEIITAPPLKYMTEKFRFYGWTHKMVMGCVDDVMALREELDSTDRKPWIGFEDSLYQKGERLFLRYSDEKDTLYDKPYAEKLAAIREMIGDDVYFMLGAVKPGNELWIVRFKPRRIWANERWAVSGPTVVIASREQVRTAKDLKVVL